MSYTEFYITKGSAVSDNNGGGPSLGTNDGPIDTNSDCSTDSGGGVISSAAGAWTNTSVGDWVCFDPAGTADFARVLWIIAEALAVTPNVTGSASGKVCNVGGAWATIQRSFDVVTTSFVNAAGDWPRINLKFDAAAYNEHPNTVNAGSTTVRIRLEGYETTPGDECPNGNRPEINDNTGDAVEAAVHIDQGFLDFAWFDVVTAQNEDHAFKVTAGDQGTITGVKTTATGSGGRGFNLVRHNWTVANCFAVDNVGAGFFCSGISCVFIGCVSTDNGSYGWQTTATRETILIDCLAGSNGDDGIYIQGEFHIIIGCTLYNNSGSGIRFDDPAGYPQGEVLNCIFVDNSVYGIESDIQMPEREDFNAFYNNTSGEVLNVPNRGASDVTLTADPFTNAAGGDLSLNEVQGGGAACRSAGFPGSSIDLVNRGHRDIGALQHRDRIEYAI